MSEGTGARRIRLAPVRALLLALLCLFLPWRGVGAQAPECGSGTSSITAVIDYPDRSSRDPGMVEVLPQRCGRTIEPDSSFVLAGLVPGTYHLLVSVPGWCIPPTAVVLGQGEDVSVRLEAIPVELMNDGRLPIAGGPNLPPTYQELSCGALRNAWASVATAPAGRPPSDIPTGPEIVDVVLADTAASRLLQVGHHSPLALYFRYDTTTVAPEKWQEVGVVLTDFPADAQPYLVVLRASARSLEIQVGTWGRDPEALRIEWSRGSATDPWGEPVSRTTLERIGRGGPS